MARIERVGAQLEKGWQSGRRDELAFPALACAALAEHFDGPEEVTLSSIVREIAAAPRLPPQNLDSKFGQPPVVLFKGGHFFIEALFWLDGTTSVHQHGFSGAFRVLAGSSLHATYDFREGERINSRLHCGEVTFLGAERLRAGDTREIRQGRAFIHALFHLERPSVTLVVRTYGNPDAQPQFDYWKPGVAIDPTYREDLGTRKLQLLDALGRLQSPEYPELAEHLLKSADYHVGLLVLADSAARPWAAPWRASLRACARVRFGSLADTFERSVDELDRKNRLVHLRGQVWDPDLRFFLALLLNVPDRQRILRLTGEQYRDKEPVAIIADWVRRLTEQPRDPGVGAAGAPLKLGDSDLVILDGVLQERPLDRIDAQLREAYGDWQIDENRAEIASTYQVLRDLIVVKPLLTA